MNIEGVTQSEHGHCGGSPSVNTDIERWSPRVNLDIEGGRQSEHGHREGYPE